MSKPAFSSRPARRIAVLWHPDTPSHTPALKAVEEAGHTLRVQLQPVGARTAPELEGAFSAMAGEPTAGQPAARPRFV